MWKVLKSLGVEEWLVEIVESMYRNAQSRVRVNGAFIDDFLIHAGLHQSSMLSHLFFCRSAGNTLPFRENRSAFHEELLYTDDFV